MKPKQWEPDSGVIAQAIEEWEGGANDLPLAEYIANRLMDAEDEVEDAPGGPCSDE